MKIYITLCTVHRHFDHGYTQKKRKTRKVVIDRKYMNGPDRLIRYKRVTEAAVKKKY